MRVLVVEDDEFKAKDLLAALPGEYDIAVVRSVRDAVVRVMKQEFELVVLDMALPTFSTHASSGGGTAQAQGGVEVVRAMQAKGSGTAVVIVSQYPDVEIDGKFVALERSAEALSTRYGVRVIGAVVYDFRDKAWVTQLQEVMSTL